MDSEIKKNISMIEKLDEKEINEITRYGFMYGLLQIAHYTVLYYDAIENIIRQNYLYPNRENLDHIVAVKLFETLKSMCDDRPNDFFFNHSRTSDLIRLAQIYGLAIYSEYMNDEISGYGYNILFFNYITGKYVVVYSPEKKFKMEQKVYDDLLRNIIYCQRQSPFYPIRSFGKKPLILSPLNENQLVVSNFYFLKKINHPDQEYPDWRLNLNFYNGNPYYYNCCPHTYDTNSGYTIIEITKNVLFYYGITQENNVNQYPWLFLTSYHRALIYANNNKKKILIYKTIAPLWVISLLDFKNYLRLFEDVELHNPFYTNKYNLQLFVKEFLLFTSSDQLKMHLEGNDEIKQNNMKKIPKQFQCYFCQQTLNYQIHSINEIFFYFLKKYLKKFKIDGIVIPKTYPNGIMTCADEGELVIFSKKKLSYFQLIRKN